MTDEAAAERERAARICEALVTGHDDAADEALNAAAAAIRDGDDSAE